MDKRHITDERQVLTALSREAAANRKEASLVVSGGAGSPAWPVTVKSHVAWNVYRVRMVALGEAGSVPIEIGHEIEATNLSESFTGEGALPPGTFALLFRAGERNVFHAKP